MTNICGGARNSVASPESRSRYRFVEPRGIEPLTPALQRRILLPVKGLQARRDAKTHNYG
jgi:hypothetical protein